MKTLRARRRVFGLSSALLLGLAAACVTHSPAGSPATAPAAGRVPSTLAASSHQVEIRAGEPIVGELRTGETLLYTLRLEAKQYVRLRLEQPEAAVEAVLQESGDEAPVEAGPTARWGERLISLVSPVASEYRLSISLRPGVAEAKVRVRLEERREAEDRDFKLVEAHRAFSEAIRAREKGTSEGHDLAMAKLRFAQGLSDEIGDDKGRVDASLQIGWLHIVQGAFPLAVEELEGALATARSIDYEIGEAFALNDLALARSLSGEMATALQLYQAALVLWERLSEVRERGVTQCNLGTLHLMQGENEQAYAYYERSLPFLVSSNDIATQAIATNGIGLVYKRRGELERATERLTTALDLSRKAGDLRTESNVVNGLAGIHRWRGELQEALELNLRALHGFRAAGDRGLEASTLQALGSLYLELGDDVRALAAYEEALELYRQTGQIGWEAFSLATIGWLHYIRGDADESLGYYQQTLELVRSHPNRRVEALALHYSGIARASLGELPAAIDLLETALPLREATSRRIDEALTRLELGVVYAHAGRPDRAREELDRALMLSRQVEHPAVQALCLLRRADLDHSVGRLNEALVGAKEALEIVESLRNRVGSRQLRISYLASKHSYYETYVDLLLELHRRQPSAGYDAQALQVCERARARSLLELLTEGRVAVEQGIASELRDREAKLDRRLAALQLQLIDVAADQSQSATLQPLRAQLVRLTQERDQLEWEVRRRHPAYAELRYPTPVGLDVIQRELDSVTAFVEFFLGAERSHAFVVTSEGLSTYDLPGTTELESAVARVRQAISRRERRVYGQYLESARRLYDVLLAPAAEILARKPRLLIAPSGPLYALPFEVLLTKEALGADLRTLPYLIATHTISYVPSATVLESLRSRGAPERVAKRFVGFALASSASLRSSGLAVEKLRLPSLEQLLLRDLPNARREVDDIARIYPSSEVAVYTDDAAAEGSVKGNSLLANAEHVHFATHGFVDEEQPELSGLVLARGTGSSEDGLLQVHEIFNLRLRADVVVLSACETGLGRQVSGEGMIGLTRAFFYAGARSLVVSLWQVADAPTPEFMVHFYRGLEEGRDRADALRRAKLELIRSQRFAHPFYWAAFVLVGDAAKARPT